MVDRRLASLTRRLGRGDLAIGPIGFGAFKIGRNRGIKYPTPYELPEPADVHALLDGVLEAGINFIDTAPAYGLSEERIGEALALRRREIVLCTKVGETFDEGGSTYDFSSTGIRKSVQRSLGRLRTDTVDLLLIHSDGNDLDILTRSDAPETLRDLKSAGLTRAIGFSGKTVEGAQTALSWADAIMVEYHPDDVSHEGVMAAARDADVAVIVKKGLASGRLRPADAIPFILANDAVDVLVIGGLSLEHLRENVAIAEKRG